MEPREHSAAVSRVSRAERALLDAIFAAPDDDVPRLVYADWLQRQEGAALQARGELISLQCAMYRATPAEHNRLKGRETELVEHFADTWCAEVGLVRPPSTEQRRDPRRIALDDWSVEIERGFFERVSMSASRFPKVALRLFAREAVRALELHQHAGALAGRLGRVVHFGRLEKLVLSWNGLGDAGVAALSRSPHLGRLAHLRIAHNLVTDEGLAALAAAELPCLVSLGLDANHIDGRGLAALASAPWAGRLAELDLDDNPLEAAAATALVRGFGTLRSLRVQGTGLDEPSLGALVERFGDRVVC